MTDVYGPVGLKVGRSKVHKHKSSRGYRFLKVTIDIVLDEWFGFSKPAHSLSTSIEMVLAIWSFYKLL